MHNLFQIALITNIENILLSSNKYIEKKCFEYFNGYVTIAMMTKKLFRYVN